MAFVFSHDMAPILKVLDPPVEMVMMLPATDVWFYLLLLLVKWTNLHQWIPAQPHTHTHTDESVGATIKWLIVITSSKTHTTFRRQKLCNWIRSTGIRLITIVIKSTNHRPEHSSWWRTRNQLSLSINYHALTDSFLFSSYCKTVHVKRK